MTQAKEDPRTDTSQHAAAIARWDDEGGAPNSFPSTTSDNRSGTSASWFVPPIVVPAFFAALIIITVIYQRSWQFVG
jgi:hypothetical protein